MSATFHREWFEKDGGWLVMIALVLAIMGGVVIACDTHFAFALLAGSVVLLTDIFLLVILWEASLRHSDAGGVKVSHFDFPHKFTSIFLVLYILVALVLCFGRLYLWSDGVHTAPPGSELLNSRLDAVYFSAVTITTLGYGDFVPFTRGARWLVIGELASGVLLLIMTIPIVASRLASFEGSKDQRGHILPWY